jgi:hypothetical protein
MKFINQFVNEIDGYCLGSDVDSGTLYLSIPVGNSMADYDEYYKITQHQFDQFKTHIEIASEFSNQCKNRKMDHLLILLPGRDRGTPR